MPGWARDVRYALRQLRKTPTFTLTAIVTLALGIGANSTIFSWMSSTLFSPVPGANPHTQLISMTRGEQHGISYPDFKGLRAHTRTLSGIIGRTINLNQHPFTVIGVAPPLFQGSQPGLRMDLWAPLMMHQQLASSWDAIHDRNGGWLSMMGTIAPGVTREQAQHELTVEMQQIARPWPQEHLGRNDIVTYPMWRAPDSANQYLYTMLSPLMAIALVVLHVRVAGDPRAYAAPVEKAVHSLNADVPVLYQFPLTRNVEIASIGTRVAGSSSACLASSGWPSPPSASMASSPTPPASACMRSAFAWLWARSAATSSN